MKIHPNATSMCMSKEELEQVKVLRCHRLYIDNLEHIDTQDRGNEIRVQGFINKSLFMELVTKKVYEGIVAQSTWNEDDFILTFCALKS